MSLRQNILNPKIRPIQIILFVVVIAAIFGRLMYLGFTAHGVSTRKILPEFHELFTMEAKSKLNVPFTYESNYESLSSNYYYDDRYYLSVRKFLLAKNTFIENLILEKNGSPFFTGGIFSESESNFLDMGFKNKKADTIKHIELYLKGDSITTVAKNDTMLCYYLKAKSFYLYYNGTDFPDIKGEAQHDNTPVSILFIKKDKKMYLLIMDIKEAGQTMRPDLLYSLVKK